MKKSLPLLAVMAVHFAAFQSKAQTFGAYEQRDEPSIKSVADALDKIATAFDEYKKTNDARIEAVKSGASTEALDAKLAKIDAHIDSLGEMKAKLEKMETKLARPGAGEAGRQEGESKEAVEYRPSILKAALVFP